MIVCDILSSANLWQDVVIEEGKMRKVLGHLVNWFGAVIVAMIIMNVLLAFYHRSAAWIDRPTCATRAIYWPGASILFGTEGRGYHKVDSRGYVNDIDELADDYVIAVGASHSQGKEVGAGERYVDLMNEWLGYSDKAYVYCVSQSANYYPSIVSGFKALIQEFPESSKIIIEIGKTDFSVYELEKALDQREFDNAMTGENILSALSMKKKAILLLKEYSPLLFNVNEKINEIEQMNAKDTSAADITYTLVDYENALDKTLELMKAEYDGELIILFHPNVLILEDGSLAIEKAETDVIFKNECEKYGIRVVDMGDKFISEYNKDYSLPYGFFNSKMGSGHINADGHRMIAEELLSVVSPEEK